jgi:hypothetical protein
MVVAPGAQELTTATAATRTTARTSPAWPCMSRIITPRAPAPEQLVAINSVDGIAHCHSINGGVEALDRLLYRGRCDVIFRDVLAGGHVVAECQACSTQSAHFHTAEITTNQHRAVNASVATRLGSTALISASMILTNVPPAQLPGRGAGVAAELAYQPCPTGRGRS